MKSTIDLHTHSTASDGVLPPAELLQEAASAGLQVIALTDHDSTEGMAEASTAASRYHIELIPGIEINTEIEGMDVHVLGYYLDYQQPSFQKTLATLRNLRVERAKRMVQKLNAIGCDISWERVREIAKGAVGRPHVAQALIEKGYCSSVSEAFEKYLGRGKPGYIPRYMLSPENACRMITSARGVPVLAHPAKIKSLEILLPTFMNVGLLGLETYYGDYTEADINRLRELAGMYGLLSTGGSDYHGSTKIHVTPLGGRFVPPETVNELKRIAQDRAVAAFTPFELPPLQQEQEQEGE